MKGCGTQKFRPCWLRRGRVCTRGNSNLPKVLQEAYAKIGPGEGMTRKQFKKALTKLKPDQEKTLKDWKDKALRTLASRLILTADEAALRGEGRTRLLYIICKGKSAEISWDENDELWVEYWDPMLPTVPPESAGSCD